MARLDLVAHRALFGYLVLASLAQADDTYYFTGAVHVSDGNDNYSPAVQAQCPHDHPIACHNINEPNYCCPSDHTCSYASDHTVACCRSGQSCSGWSSGSGAYVGANDQDYHPPPTTVYQPAQTDYDDGSYVGGAAANDNDDRVNYGDQQYCQTIVAEGPGLPTTDEGECGTILIVEDGAGVKLATEIAWWITGILALHALGGGLFIRW